MKPCGVCGELAVVVKVENDLGLVDLVVCLRCDRSRCHKCSRNLPGTAKACPNCGALVEWTRL